MEILQIFQKKIAQWLFRNKSILFISLLLLADFIIRGRFLSSNSIDLDEPFSLFYAQMSISDIVQNLKTGNNPPLYEILMHYWTRLFGGSVFSVRVPSLIFSLMTIWVVFRTAKQFINDRTAVLASILLSLSVNHVYFSHEARVYSLLIFLTAFSFHLCLDILRNKASVRNLIFLCVTYILMGYAHYFGLLVICAQILIFLIIKPSPPHGRRYYFIALGAFILAYLPFLPVVITRFFESAGNGTWITPSSSITDVFYIIKTFANDDRYVLLICLFVLFSAAWLYVQNTQVRFIKPVLLYLVIPIFFLVSVATHFNMPFFWKIIPLRITAVFFTSLIAALYIFFFIKDRNKRDATSIIAGWFILPVTLLFLISLYIPCYINRYLVFILPAFFITIAAAVNNLFHDKRSFTLFSLILITYFAVTFLPNPHNSRFTDKIADDVKAHATSDTKIIICPYNYDLTFAYHYCPDCFRDYENTDIRLKEMNVCFINDTNGIAEIVGNSDQTIFVDAHASVSFPGNGIHNWLASHYTNEKLIVYPDSSKVFVFSENKQSMN